MYRTLDTRTWDDPKIRHLEPSAKLLFVYLITNRHTHISGLYYLSTVTMAHDLVLTEKSIRGSLAELEKAKMTFYDHENSVVWIVNMLRYQARGPKASKAVQTQLSSLHNSPLIDSFIKHYPEFEEYKPKTNGYPIEGVSIPYRDQKQDQYQYQEQDQDSARSDSSESSSPPVLTLKLANNSEYPITQQTIDEFTPLYPGIEVKAECLKAKAWLISNPTKRKTARGIMAFLNRWFSNAQDRSGQCRASPQEAPKVEDGEFFSTGRTYGHKPVG